MNELAYALGSQAVNQLAAATDDYECTLLGRRWTVPAGVYPPDLAPATGLFTERLPWAGVRTFLEMGCGSGLTSVYAALRGCTVTAVDIDEAAVRGTRANAERHGVADRVQVLRGDLFAPVPAGAQFDLLYWNSPFVEPPPDRDNTGPGDPAIFDPGYRMHADFLRDAPAHRAPGGRIVLGFSNSMGNPDLLRDCAQRAGLVGRVLYAEEFVVPVPVGDEPPQPLAFDFRLLEFVPAGRSG